MSDTGRVGGQAGRVALNCAIVYDDSGEAMEGGEPIQLVVRPMRYSNHPSRPRPSTSRGRRGRRA
jgi:hypothetical protein